MPTPLIKCLLTRGKEKQSNKMETEMGKWFWNIKDIKQDKTFGFGCGNNGQRDQARLNIYQQQYQQNTKKRKIACQVWYFENAIITQTFFFHFHEKQEKTIHLQHISTIFRNKALFLTYSTNKWKIFNNSNRTQGKMCTNTDWVTDRLPLRLNIRSESTWSEKISKKVKNILYIKPSSIFPKWKMISTALQVHISNPKIQSRTKLLNVFIFILFSYKIFPIQN